MIYINARFLTQSMTGVQRFAVEICLKLKVLLGENVIFLSPKGITQKEYVDRLGVIEIGTHTGHLWEQWDLPNYLRKQGDPLLLCLCNTAPIRHKNKVVTVHDLAFEVFPQTFSKSFLYLYRFMIPRIMKTAKHVITVSEFSKQEIIKYYNIPDNKISVVYNAVSSDFMPKEKTEGCKKYYMAVSSLNYRKNFLYILEAFEKYVQEDGDGELYIIGDIKNKAFAKIDLAKYENNPKIKFLGRVSDDELINYYCNAFAFIYPSLYEGFGIPPLESQACNCPAICADASCLPEVFGNSVLYCDPYKKDSLVTSMKELSDNSLRNDLIARGKENLAKYSWERSANRIKNILELYDK